MNVSSFAFLILSGQLVLEVVLGAVNKRFALTHHCDDLFLGREGLSISVPLGPVYGLAEKVSRNKLQQFWKDGFNLGHGLIVILLGRLGFYINRTTRQLRLLSHDSYISHQKY